MTSRLQWKRARRWSASGGPSSARGAIDSETCNTLATTGWHDVTELEGAVFGIHCGRPFQCDDVRDSGEGADVLASRGAEHEDWPVAVRVHRTRASANQANPSSNGDDRPLTAGRANCVAGDCPDRGVRTKQHVVAAALRRRSASPRPLVSGGRSGP